MNNPLPSEVIEGNAKGVSPESVGPKDIAVIYSILNYLDQLARLNPDLKLPKL